MNLQTLTGSDELTQFYNKKFYFSYSSINKLLFSPRAFYSHYVLNQREDSTDAHLVTGRVLHCLLLEEQNYDKQFITMASKIPSENNKKIVDMIFKYHCTLGNDSLNLEDYSQEILSHLLTVNLHQSLKTDEQRLAKILTEENKDYFTFLKNSQGKTVVDQDTLNGCKESIEVLRSNSSVRALLQLDKADEDDHITIFNELPLEISVDYLPFGFKGILDNVVIDSESKTIFINDLKTTGKNLADFPDAVKYYKYWIQAVVYHKMAYYKFVKGLPDEVDWNIVVTFIVIDKYNQVYPFQVSQESLAIWQQEFENIEDIVKYHYENKDYTLPYELAIGNVKL
jgi:hypothetical protein